MQDLSSAVTAARVLYAKQEIGVTFQKELNMYAMVIIVMVKKIVVLTE